LTTGKITGSCKQNGCGRRVNKRAAIRCVSLSIGARRRGEQAARLNFQRGEPDNVTIVPGRTITTGVRLSFY